MGLTLVLATLLAAPADGAAVDDFATCVRQLRSQAAARGVSTATFDHHLRGLDPDMDVVALLDYQPEFRAPIWDYLATMVDEERVSDGRAMLEKWKDTLAAIRSRFHVAPATVVAVWGVESDFGRKLGKRPLVRSLATLSCFGRRQDYFRGEFFAALRILQQGHIPVERLTGSWAGAFGQTQFMPSTFERLAVDFDGDGRRDLVDNERDALASTANFLLRAGWRDGEPWGWEVLLPPGFDPSLAGRRNRRALEDWARRGLKKADGSPLPVAAPPGAGPPQAGGSPPGGQRSVGAHLAGAGPSQAGGSPLGGQRSVGAHTPAGLLLPAGTKGPAFLVFRNFDAIYSYNAAESYALAIAHLSDRLGNEGGTEGQRAPASGHPFVTPWPTDDPGLSREQQRELQELLVARRHDIGAVDGMIGAATREAVRKEQRLLGLEPDGRAGRRLLDVLRRNKPAPAGAPARPVNRPATAGPPHGGERPLGG
ncbi:MAG: lytic murein transglycosylase [Betaproteobacteria bacterium]|nr:lytic murein transglycosylase [Betaproteobacteria bacterium]